MTNESDKQVWVDSAGNHYSTRVDMYAATRLRDSGFDLKDAEAVAKWFADPYTAMDLCSALLRPRWEELGLTEVEFLDNATHSGTSFPELLEAVQRGLIDFFLRCGDQLRAKVLERAISYAAIAQQRQIAIVQGPKANQAVESTLANAERNVDAALDKIIFGATSGT